MQLAAAESYEERSLLRQALRQKKKERGEQPFKKATRGSAYNRFAATTRGTVSTPKNYVASSQSVVSQLPYLVLLLECNSICS